MSTPSKPQLRLNNDEILLARARLGLNSYGALAAHTGLSKATIERAVSGERLSGNTLATLSLRLGIPIYVLAIPVHTPQDAAS